MDELIKALDANGYASNPSRTLSYIIANTKQDAQYSPKSYENYNILCKYEEQYGHLTVEVLRKLTK
jgi:uncharacterized protein YozE (UPF0346 family)